ncbi:hypothetical protein GQR58_026849 [Nymphon striatum]|nr:hypothetical protein GQR58_026849 [Nymphon striatum]
MKNYCLVVLCSLLLTNCATQKTKYASDNAKKEITTSNPISHTVYLIGDAGLSKDNMPNAALRSFKNRLDKADKNSTAIFLGDNIYPAGMPSKKKEPIKYKKAKSYLDAQLSSLENYKGKPLFIPGNHDWYAEVEKIEVNDDVVIIAVDTEWYLTNWDKHPNMNDDCEIKDREKFFEEMEGLIKKGANKTTIIALHHPMTSYGVHGGQFSLKQHLFPANNGIPLPIIGSVINLLRKASGTSQEDLI